MARGAQWMHRDELSVQGCRLTVTLEGDLQRRYEELGGEVTDKKAGDISTPEQCQGS